MTQMYKVGALTYCAIKSFKVGHKDWNISSSLIFYLLGMYTVTVRNVTKDIQLSYLHIPCRVGLNLIK